ncbi:MAG: glycosyltransferase [Verrucomicrobia bacterium]|nr:MAG: glycosyltransferase [Verrucomicrobiota bacterium]
MISIIIPTLNEAELLPGTLNRVQANRAPHEILVVDGGSTDETVALANASGARVISSAQTRRAAQMNLGTRMARGDIFLFLHGDTWTGPDTLKQIENALRQSAVAGGGFARRFQSRSRLLRLTCLLGEWRSRCFRWFYGDQGIFVRRTIFERVGGFQDMPLFEDVDFSRRMARQGRVVTLRSEVVSSARRFAARGALMTTASDVWLTVRYFAGADPKRLAAERKWHESRPDNPLVKQRVSP